jgi:hypothetical protein
MNMAWFWDNILGVVGILISSFIAYHIFSLSKRISNRERLEHKEQIKEKADGLIAKIIREKLRRKVYLVNINRYFKDYPSNEEKLLSGYSHIRAEIKATRFNGIEFFAGMPVQIYQKQNGRLSLKGYDEEKVFIAFPVGLVPYEWIEYIDPDGDEYDYSPLVYCKFNSRIYWKPWRRFLSLGYPHEKIYYYKKSNVYNEDNDPADMEYSLIDEPISKR